MDTSLKNEHPGVLATPDSTKTCGCSGTLAVPFLGSPALHETGTLELRPSPANRPNCEFCSPVLVTWNQDIKTGAIQFVSAALEQLWRRPVSELKAGLAALVRWAHPQDGHALQSLLQGGGAGTAEYRILWPDQTTRWIRTVRVPMHDESGNLVRLAYLSEDLTERKQAEESMRVQKFALEASANGIVITDIEGTILWANQAFSKMTGYSLAEAQGQCPDFLKSNQQEPAFYSAMWTRILAGETWHGELINRRKDATLYTEEMTITPCQNSTGQITHFIAIKQDITGRKQLEAQYLRSQRMETIGALASGIAHDLNNMLAPVLMCVSLLRGTTSGEEQEKLLQILENSACHGGELIKQVLAFARGVANQPMLLQPVRLIKEFKKLVDNTFPKSIQITADLPATSQTIQADPTQLHQVLMNLCVNARDAMPHGGVLSIALRDVVLDEHLCALVPEARPGEYVLISVTDTGAGIPPELREKIFEPFFTTKETGKGTGLGLTTTQAIVRAHGGFIGISSEPEHGTQFKVYLPASPENAPTTHHPRSSPELRGNSELVLVIDDEESVRNVCMRTLQHFGYRGLLASNGVEAVPLFAQHADEVAVVITDMMMPVMDGPATIKALRSIRPDLKVICTSGMGADSALFTQADVSLNFFLPKPFTASALLQMLSDTLHNQPS